MLAKEVKIRLAENYEFDAYNEMLKAFVGMQTDSVSYEKKIKGEHIYFCVSTDGHLEEIKGFANLYAFDDGVGYIDLFYVNSEEVKSKFLELIEKEFVSVGMEKITIELLSGDEEDFFGRRGYKSSRGTEEFVKTF